MDPASPGPTAGVVRMPGRDMARRDSSPVLMSNSCCNDLSRDTRNLGSWGTDRKQGFHTNPDQSSGINLHVPSGVCDNSDYDRGVHGSEQTSPSAPGTQRPWPHQRPLLWIRPPSFSSGYNTVASRTFSLDVFSGCSWHLWKDPASAHARRTNSGAQGSVPRSSSLPRGPARPRRDGETRAATLMAQEMPPPGHCLPLDDSGIPGERGCGHWL